MPIFHIISSSPFDRLALFFVLCEDWLFIVAGFYNHLITGKHQVFLIKYSEMMDHKTIFLFAAILTASLAKDCCDINTITVTGNAQV